MRRRTFLLGTLSQGASGYEVLAQTRLPIIGFLHVADIDHYRDMIEVFTQALSAAGFSQGRNISIVYKWADNDLERLPMLANELVAAGADVIVTGGGSPSTIAARNATSKIPIVFSMGEDPVALGIVSSLNRPGGNITGSTFLGLSLWNKRLELVRDLFPNAHNVAVLIDNSTRTVKTEIGESLDAANILGLTLRHSGFSGPSDFEQALTEVMSSQPDVIVAGASVRLTTLHPRVVEAATSAGIPVIGSTSGWVASGAVASIGGRIADGYQRSGEYVARILKGTPPGDLPVLLPTRFETSLNAQVAKKLGIVFSQATLARADEVIE